MLSLGKIDLSIYRCVTPDIVTDEVILTDERISHIRERHPGHFEAVFPFLPFAIQSPDYILEDTPSTGLILKMIETSGLRFQVVLRIRTSPDPEGYKNSILSAWKISERRWNNYIKNKKFFTKGNKSGILYIE